MNLHRILDTEVEEGEENADCNERVMHRRQSKMETKDSYDVNNITSKDLQYIINECKA